ncbi:MAG: nucleoside 2-deoxyribosyltransferase [Methanocalculus sp. MSAO_Arc2]|uniref:nucleoside 2-deoxyribosyltransferase n=1 Tax=Methanocalculus sp. MSAO_Arc2 TaxID=2293855 RepID=UPI000FF76766|nr:MAG: nucleoside 2-deoxyribosyltransferase [Methanocalculus sp. MSAO_Arc2]
MYVMIVPCIPDPSLRAEGITGDEDMRAYARCLERCKVFGLDVVLLPCPETLYLGKNRAPGSFLDRLDTDEFSSLLDELESVVRKIIFERGEPLCIVGVDSSPACGVKTTWFASDEKSNHRGAFLSRFPEIPAIDVYDFARYRVYLASPLFSEAERRYNEMIRDLLTTHCFEVYFPQEVGQDTSYRPYEAMEAIFNSHCAALKNCDWMVAIIDGSDADSGTAWEMGYVCALGIPVISLRTDFRQVGQNEYVNLMLELSSTVVTKKEDLPRALISPLYH